MRAGHMEVRAIYENREASKCRRLILDSPGLSKTVVLGNVGARLSEGVSVYALLWSLGVACGGDSHDVLSCRRYVDP
jgi:hypothetical protein